MTATTTNLKAQLQARIDAATGATPLKDLMAIRLAASGLGCNEANLDTLVTARLNAMDASTELKDLLAGNKASDLGAAAPVIIGGMTKLPAHFPDIYVVGEEEYLRAGVFKTADYAPELEFSKRLTIPFQPFNGGATTLIAGVNGAGRNGDSDGNGRWIFMLTGSVPGAYLSTNNGESYTSIQTAVGGTPGTGWYVKHISGVGASSVWLIQSGTVFKRSADGGVTWSTVATGVVSNNPFITANGSTVLISAGTNSYRRSTDSGVTFGSSITFSGTDAQVFDCINCGAGKFVACGRTDLGGNYVATIWVSEDDGVSFGAAQVVFPTSANQVFDSVLYSALTGRVYLTLANGSATHYLQTYTESTFTTPVYAFSHGNAGTNRTTVRLNEYGVIIVRSAPAANQLNLYEETLGQAGVRTIGQIKSNTGDSALEYSKGTWMLIGFGGGPFFRGVPAVGAYLNFAGTTYKETNMADYMRIK